MLTAVYDLARNDPTFVGVALFLLRAEQERLWRNEIDIEIDIIPGNRASHGPETPRILDVDVVPLCRMLPSVRRVSVHKSRPPLLPTSFGGKPDAIFGWGVSFDLPVDLPWIHEQCAVVALPRAVSAE